MKEKILILKSEIKNDLESVKKLCGFIDALAVTLKPGSPQKDIIAVSYYLHNLYTAFENIFKNIARCFENTIDDLSRCHKELLKRMTMDIENIRMRVIGDESYKCLEELRRFRHIFRYSYEEELNEEKLRIVLKAARKLKTSYEPDFRKFTAFLDTLVENTEDEEIRGQSRREI